MKRVISLLFAFVLFAPTIYGQIYVKPNKTWMAFDRLKVDSTFTIPFRDTVSKTGVIRAGAMLLNTYDTSSYIYTGVRFKKIPYSQDVLNYNDTASLVAPYLRKADTSSLSRRIDLQVKYTDTLISGRFLTKPENFGNVIIDSLVLFNNTTQKLKIIPTTALSTLNWSTRGNSGTNPAINYIGTNSNVDFVMKRNNVEAGRIALNSVSYGHNALANGALCVSIGENSAAPALEGTAVGQGTNAGIYGVAIGKGSSSSTSGYSTATGHGSSASGPSSTANGSSSSASGSESISIGRTTSSTSAGGINIGNSWFGLGARGLSTLPNANAKIGIGNIPTATLDVFGDIKINKPITGNSGDSILVWKSIARTVAVIKQNPALDTSSLSSRIDLRVKYTDTAAMLAPYLTYSTANTTYLSNLKSEFTLDFVSINANEVASQAISFLGANVGDIVLVSPPDSVMPSLFNAYVDAPNSIIIYYYNTTSSVVDLSPSVFKILIIK